MPDLGLVPLQSAAHWTLATPPQLPQNAPGLRRMVADATFGLDQVRHAPRGPQIGSIPQRLWPALQPVLDAPQIGSLQARLASGASGFLQRPSSAFGKLLGPAAHRLPMHSDPPGHFRLRDSLLQQLGCEEAALFQFFEVSLYSFLVSHALNIAQESQDVTI